MKKRGQIGLIIIIAVVIVILSIFFYLFYSSGTESKTKAAVRKSISVDFQPVVQYAEESLKQIAINGIIGLGEHGGRINPQGPKSVEKIDITTGEKIRVVYGLQNGVNVLPAISDMENELEIYLKERMINEIKFDEFIRRGYEIESPSQEKIDATVTIGDNELKVEITYPLSIKLGDDRQLKEDFDIIIPSNLGRIREIGSGLVDGIISNGKLVDITTQDYSCKKMRVSYIIDNNNNQFVRIMRYNPPFAKEDYIFYFAVESSQTSNRFSCLGGTCICP